MGTSERLVLPEVCFPHIMSNLHNHFNEFKLLLVSQMKVQRLGG